MIRIENKMPQFKISMKGVMNDALREGARDILINAKTKAPILHGALRANSNVQAVSTLAWRISFLMEYARYQEFGGDRNHIIKRYTTSGTGAHFLKNAGDDMRHKLDGIFKKHGLRAKVW